MQGDNRQPTAVLDPMDHGFVDPAFHGNTLTIQGPHESHEEQPVGQTGGKITQHPLAGKCKRSEHFVGLHPTKCASEG
ncbi:hypothetical protein Rhow_003366 [Rhodococcus wratislaviensis]|uniref:Uncharacterized protein n=1 Tax=Rhodococcus wratislaviensis TaxID=44752 RepID=A0A402C814_RHOWR|nr:hypothetical protein Rhow_003366 [Rhodococcus wratislaviensis]